ncbi:P12 family lipoprotein [Borreliella afzelii]|uniref:BBH37-like helical domain-containing protein n=1 Tax=Borreliella afzelii TaxID=29518 RepID=A0AB34Z3M0_BORAF|nr:hypothetical protein [Borreliella afzelii]
MGKNLFLYILLMLGLMSCSLDSKLFGNKEQNNNDNVKEVLDSVQKDSLKNLYSSQEEQKGFNKNFGERKYQDLIVPIGPIVSSKSLNNKVDIPNISTNHAKKKEIKKEDLVPFTYEERRASEVIKNIQDILKDSGFFKLIEDVCVLKDEYILIKDDFNNVMSKIQNKKASLMENLNNNKNKIRELAQLQNELKIGFEFDEFINKIDMAEQEIRSAALFFDIAQKSLEESIIKRLESKNKASYALKLSREALSKAESTLDNLDSYFLKKAEAMVKKQELEKLIEHVKTVLKSIN